MPGAGFTIIWKIKNFSFLPKLHKKEKISSPIFTADNFEKTSWSLRLYPVGYSDEDDRDKYVFRLEKISETGPNCILLDYELSVLSNAGSKNCGYEKFVKVNKFWFHMGNAHGTPLCITPNEIFSKREVLPRDTLTVRCKMWFHSQWNSEPGFSLALTKINVERKFFTWTIDNFSSLIAEDSKSASVVMFSSQQIYLTLTFKISMENVVIRMEGRNKGRNSVLLLGISVQDTNDASAYHFQHEYMLKKENEENLFPLIIERAQLMKDKDRLLPGDKLSLKCDLEVYDVVMNRIELSGFGANSTSDLEAALNNTNQSLLLGKRKRHSSSNSLTKDLRYLFEEKQHADVSLRVHNETFPVHKAVLAARSSVFKTMFDTDMKEKLTNVIEIDDVQPDTMRRLLIYIYSDTMDSDIQWENASNLYLVAEKYAVLGLKKECTSYLKANLSVTNACDALVLADMLSDNDLNNFVLSFIQDKAQAVLNSDEWKKFAQTHPQLTIDILTRLYKYVKQI